jgi:LysR family glycine cleavage system transcriptional activator
MFADTRFDAALFAGTSEQVANWAGTQAMKLLGEDVLPVCSPRWLKGQPNLSPQAIADLPLLQQSTRPLAWRQWFEAQGVVAPQALAGPRYELFSMTAAAAVHGMGLALVPRLLVSDELTRGDLVVACVQPLTGARAYYLVLPEGDDNPPVTQLFKDWLLEVLHTEAAG